MSGLVRNRCAEVPYREEGGGPEGGGHCGGSDDDLISIKPD